MTVVDRVVVPLDDPDDVSDADTVEVAVEECVVTSQLRNVSCWEARSTSLKVAALALQPTAPLPETRRFPFVASHVTTPGCAFVPRYSVKMASRRVTVLHPGSESCSTDWEPPLSWQVNPATDESVPASPVN